MDDREKLVVDNLNLVHFVLRKYIHVPEGMYEDLYQEGCLGLCKAANSYDESKAKFSTYAVRLILSQIRLYFRDNNLIHTPRDFYKNGGELQVSSIDEELNDDGFQLIDVLEDEYALDDLNCQLLEDSILLEAQRIFQDYCQLHVDVCLEDLCSKMWDEPVTQNYLAEKYKISQAQISRILRKFYIELKGKL